MYFTTGRVTAGYNPISDGPSSEQKVSPVAAAQTILCNVYIILLVLDTIDLNIKNAICHNTYNLRMLFLLLAYIKYASRVPRVAHNDIISNLGMAPEFFP